MSTKTQCKQVYRLRKSLRLAAEPGAGWADWFWPEGGCRGGAWNIGGVDQPKTQSRRSIKDLVFLCFNASVSVLPWAHHSSRVRCDRPVELRLWSSSWEGRKPVGLGEGGHAAGPLLAVPVVNTGTLGGSNTPKASCHSLLNSSLAPGPGLRRSLRKAMSPRSPSSSSGRSPVPAGWGRPPERRGQGQRWEGWCLRPRADTSVDSEKAPHERQKNAL